MNDPLPSLSTGVAANSAVDSAGGAATVQSAAAAPVLPAASQAFSPSAPGGGTAAAPGTLSHGGGGQGPQRDLPANPGAGIDYRRFLDCIHCGLCTAACPTYLELGNENDSPRGRIYLMRAVTDGRLHLTPEVQRHLDLCLDCRACETACPSGVQYGRLIEPFRVAMEELGVAGRTSQSWFHRLVLHGVFPYPQRMRPLLRLARWSQRLGLVRLIQAARLTRLLPGPWRQMVEMLPPLPRPAAKLPTFVPAVGARRRRVALFTGCIADAMFRHMHWATLRVLARNGCDVVIPQNQVCCGAIHLHSGAGTAARTFAEQNLAAFEVKNLDAIVVNVAGCGAMLKDYGHHWHDERQAARAQFASIVRDVHEFLDELGLVPPEGKLPLVATYHDACHLGHAQRIREAPRRLLAQIPELQLRELPESEVCCGAAGTYNLTQPEMAQRLAERKVRQIVATGAQAVLVGNCTCLMHIERFCRAAGHRLWFAQPIELLDLSYQGQRPRL